MNYIKHYNLLVEKRKNIIPEGYTERHHIIPKCMGGTDDASNIVVLTAKEHYVAHHLLYKHYKTSSLAHAWFSMCRSSDNQERDYITTSMYEQAKVAHSKAISERMSNKPQSEIDNWVKKVASKPKTAEHKAKIGRKMIMLKSINTFESIRIWPEEKEHYDLSEWFNPFTIDVIIKGTSSKYCNFVIDNKPFKDLFAYANSYNLTNQQAKLVIDGQIEAKNVSYPNKFDYRRGYGATIEANKRFNKKVEIEGVIYESIKSAIECLNMSRGRIQDRLNRDDYPAWKRL